MPRHKHRSVNMSQGVVVLPLVLRKKANNSGVLFSSGSTLKGGFEKGRARLWAAMTQQVAA
jgi:hypothetical protein